MSNRNQTPTSPDSGSFKLGYWSALTAGIVAPLRGRYILEETTGLQLMADQTADLADTLSKTLAVVEAATRVRDLYANRESPLIRDAYESACREMFDALAALK